MNLEDLPGIWSSQRQVQDIFNAHVLPRVEDGSLRPILLANRHPTRRLAREPRCTRSQYISYRDENGREIARIHQYLRPDGSIGLSGKPDPKAVRFEGVNYYCDLGF